MKYQCKLLFFPVKWIICLVFTSIIPIAMYVPTYYDFVNVSSIYLPFIAIVLFTDSSLIDKVNQIEEISFIANKQPIKTFIQRYIVMVFLLIAYILFANTVFRISQIVSGTFLNESISLFEYVMITCGGCLFVGTLSMTVSRILSNAYIGYGFSLLYWLYWNINMQKKGMLNPFPFISNPTYYEKPLLIIFVMTLVLLLVNSYLAVQSPFHLLDKLQKQFFTHS